MCGEPERSTGRGSPVRLRCEVEATSMRVPMMGHRFRDHAYGINVSRITL